MSVVTYPQSDPFPDPAALLSWRHVAGLKHQTVRHSSPLKETAGVQDLAVQLHSAKPETSRHSFSVHPRQRT